MKRKSIVIAIIFAFILLISTKVHAAPSEFVFVEDGDGINGTTKVGGTQIYCIESGLGILSSEYLYTDTNRRTTTFCAGCRGTSDLPYADAWDGSKIQSYYRFESTIDTTQHQDVMYILLHEKDTNWAQQNIWGLDINLSGALNVDTTLINTAKAYRKFYESIRGGYNTSDNTNIGNVKVGVNQNDGTYTVGPFNITYPEGKFGSEYFSKITNLTVLSETGNTLNLVGILNSSGGTCSGNNGFPASGEDFYVKFKGSAQRVSVHVKFTYLKEIEGHLYKYTGTRYKWDWQKKAAGQHQHQPEKICYGDGSCGWGTNCPKTPHTYQQAVNYQQYYYHIRRQEVQKSQTLMGYDNDAHEVWGNASLDVVPGGIDITMKIAGDVFLDEDTGKINTGDNLMDKDGKEALEGVEVTLYDSEGREVTIVENLVHQHTHECYQKPIYHVHDGDEFTYGMCYSELEHVHKGSPQTGGECYREPVYHQHVDSCYEGGKGEQKTPIYHQHTPQCYRPVYHVHTDRCYEDVRCNCHSTNHHHESHPYPCGVHCYHEGSPHSECEGWDVCDDCGHLWSSEGHCQAISGRRLKCGKDENTVEYNELICNKTEGKTIDGYTSKALICGKIEGVTVEFYRLTCTYYQTEPIPHVHTDECYEGGEGSIGVPIYHTHTPECFRPNYHVHSGNSVSGGACYEPIYHQHNESCYQTDTCYVTVLEGPWYFGPGNGSWPSSSSCYCGNGYNGTNYFKLSHSSCGKGIEDWASFDGCHNSNCPNNARNKASQPHTYQNLVCTKNENTIEGYRLKCGKDGNTIESYTLVCGKISGVSIEGYENRRLICNKTVDGYREKLRYKLTCDKIPGQTIDGYELSCGKTVDTANGTINVIEGQKTHKCVQLTNSNGHYEFTGLDAMKKYYVKFTYNGMVYTNVLVGDINNDYASKSGEKTDERTNFNNKFKLISSYPDNYQTKDCITGETIYNKTYLQEDIYDIFREVAVEVEANNGNEKAAYQAVINKMSNVAEIKQKVQYVADIRINAYSVKNYPLINEFVIEEYARTIAGKTYSPIYKGNNNQLHVNLGIKARPTFDIALYKDVLKAEVIVNGKTETYSYDARKSSGGFSVGISESDYLNGLRGAYRQKSANANANYKNEIQKIQNAQTREVDNDSYDLDIRTEEVANGQSENYNGSTTGKIRSEYKVNNNYDNLKNINSADRLKIFVTYKVSIQNQSSIIGAITELVDYYDPNYQFIEAYVGNENGDKTGDVIASENSYYFYGNTNEQNSAAAQNYRNTTENKSKNGTYKTIYLRPSSETRLSNNETQYIYIKLQLLGPSNDAGTLLSNKLLSSANGQFSVLNLVEINGYKTYNSKSSNDNSTPGLVDKDSISGNLNISTIGELTQENLLNYPGIRDMYEDDTSRAPAYIFKLLESRTLEGSVFEDYTGKDKNKIYTSEERKGNGTFDNQDSPIGGVIVELIEIKGNQMIVRSTTTTNENGWYGFTGFLPGEYTIRFTYGSNDATGMNKTSTWYKGVNETSYNGQDYQSTSYRNGETINSTNYTTDSTLISKYNTNNTNKNSEEATVNCGANQIIDTYGVNNYWYTVDSKLSDARDDAGRVQQVIDYSEGEYGKDIVNHKAEVFNAYVNPQPDHITKEFNRNLADELERRTYRYAYTPQIEVEVEYAKESVEGNKGTREETNTAQARYKHAIYGVDFGIVERPKSELVVEQDVQHIKVTSSNGATVLFDADVNTNAQNLMWVKGQETNNQYNMIHGKKVNGYDKNELINIIMDNELISGAKLEITYKITVINNGEKDEDCTSRAKSIINYVANNLTFDVEDNCTNTTSGNRIALWKVVSKEDIQNDKQSTFINNTDKTRSVKLIDLTTQTTILQTTDENPISNKVLRPGESVETTLKLKKVLSSESSADDLTYSNLLEIAEIDNTVGRYDHGAVPGNQDLQKNPSEHDAAGATKYSDTVYTQDGKIIITPPTGSTVIYYFIGIIATTILALGIYLIKKFVIGGK